MTIRKNEVLSIQEIFEVAGAIIASIGGSTVIILGLSSWLGKIWASRILEDEKKKHAIEIEDFKSKLNKEIAMANSIIDKSLHVTKLQYDKEFSIYIEIWEKLADCVVSTKLLYPLFENTPVEEELEKFNKAKYSRFVTDFNGFSSIITKYSPFYEEKLYNSFIELRDLCSRQGGMFNTYNFEVKYSLTYALARDTKMTAEERKEVYREFHDKIEVLQSSLQREIRKYLKSLQAIES